MARNRDTIVCLKKQFLHQKTEAVFSETCDREIQKEKQLQQDEESS
jgi:hypothetical protein